MKKVILLFILVLLFGCSQKTSNVDFEIDFIDVGQGDAALVMCDGHNMLIDCGDKNHATSLGLYLTQEGKQIDKIDYIICTHPDEDHVGGIQGIFSYCSNIGEIYCPQAKTNFSAYSNLESTCEANGKTIKTLSIGDKIKLSNVTVEVMAVDIDKTSENDSSIVLMITYKDKLDISGKNKKKILMMGDAETDTMLYLCNNYSDEELKCDVMKVAHHGSDNAATDYPLLFKALPKYAIISVGANNKYNHPHESVTKRLDAIGATTYMTSVNHNIIYSVTKGEESFSFK